MKQAKYLSWENLPIWILLIHKKYVWCVNPIQEGGMHKVPTTQCIVNCCTKNFKTYFFMFLYKYNISLLYYQLNHYDILVMFGFQQG